MILNYISADSGGTLVYSYRGNWDAWLVKAFLKGYKLLMAYREYFT